MYVERDPTTIAEAPQDAQEVLVERTKPLGNIPDQTKAHLWWVQRFDGTAACIAVLVCDTSGINNQPLRGKAEMAVNDSKAENNKAIVLEAFETLFNKRDYAAAERFWSPNYIQHSAHIEPGRDGLFNLIKSIPPTLKYEPGVIVAEGDFVIVHGRFSGIGLPVNWIAADIVRMQDGVLLEHWDVIQDEAIHERSKSKNPMFGDSFPNRA
jgi:predicted SnoaL-like aldol condensation-catalyzing enzyme